VSRYLNLAERVESYNGIAPEVKIGAARRCSIIGYVPRTSLAGAHAVQVTLKLGDHCESGEQLPPVRVGRVVNRTIEIELDRLRI
jgi:hypothetical protein